MTRIPPNVVIIRHLHKSAARTSLSSITRGPKNNSRICSAKWEYHCQQICSSLMRNISDFISLSHTIICTIKLKSLGVRLAICSMVGSCSTVWEKKGLQYGRVAFGWGIYPVSNGCSINFHPLPLLHFNTMV